jgi:4'-phosphopantetheinyl transferase
VRPVLALATGAEVPDDDDWLAPGERATMAGLRVPARRRDWRLGRWTAHAALAAALGPASFEVRAAPDGAPEALAAGELVAVTVSISHRAGLGACLVAGAGVAAGCDLELVEPRDAGLARDFFTPAELALVHAAPPEDRELTVALVWSAKESALKALRQGLRLDTRAVEVELDPRAAAVDGWRPLAVAHGARRFAGWWRRVGRHVLTVAADPPDGPPALRPAIQRPAATSRRRAGADSPA